MQSAYLYAYDHQNLGDDLFIETIVERYPKVRFYMWSDKTNKNNFRYLKNLTIIDKESLIVKLLKKVRPSLVLRYQNIYKNKAVVHIYVGGSIFMEYPSWENIVNWWKYQVDHYKFYILGANFGPYETKEYKLGMNKVFAKAKDICFRDTYSKHLFQKNDVVRYAPDILFAYSKIPRMVEIKKQLFISPIKCSEKNDLKIQECEEQYINMFDSILKEYYNDGYTFVFASFCEDEKDVDAICLICQKIEKWADKNCYTVLEYNGKNQIDVLEKLAESEYIIASRFHAAILGMVAQRPVFPVIYSDKTQNVLEDLKFEGNYADIRNLDNVDYEYSKKNLQNHIIVDVDELKKRAEEHFTVLNKEFV